MKASRAPLTALALSAILLSTLLLPISSGGHASGTVQTKVRITFAPESPQKGDNSHIVARLTDAQGKAIPGAALTLYGEGNPKQLYDTLRTDQNGEVRWGGFRAVKWTFTVKYAGGSTYAASSDTRTLRVRTPEPADAEERAPVQPSQEATSAPKPPTWEECKAKGLSEHAAPEVRFTNVAVSPRDAYFVAIVRTLPYESTCRGYMDTLAGKAYTYRNVVASVASPGATAVSATLLENVGVTEKLIAAALEVAVCEIPDPRVKVGCILIEVERLRSAWRAAEGLKRGEFANWVQAPEDAAKAYLVHLQRTSPEEGPWDVTVSTQATYQVLRGDEVTSEGAGDRTRTRVVALTMEDDQAKVVSETVRTGR